ncbi:DUF742 domain-containing protein [Streptomyces millisiae]|uniref:DUF742 domain-containing protein n=1 Tax=Streptomyces millisiae TaxID=3075542 RepID=A0ABU2LWH8_9ACTN|nr:DUF742 domain-containing protein [Streptomyces sp. DSM 44918]MDT0321890.1 DUF742 domain-containing protein [Streptomyces sp. DSM 44918]
MENSDIRLDTHVTTLSGDGPPAGTQFAKILTLCQTTRAVAELAAHLKIPVGVAAVLVAELRDLGHVDTRDPLDLTGDSVVTLALLERVRNGLRNAI